MSRLSFAAAALVASSCTLGTGSRPPSPGGDGVSVDPATGKIALDTASVPVLSGACSDGQVVARAGAEWKCVEAASGPRGDTGATGPQGGAGEKGDTGEPGASGPQGLQGPVGDTGPQGPAGTSIVGLSLAVNDPNCPRGGSKFVVGGDIVYACNGEPGATGIQGIAGARGDTGAIGPKGDTGTSVVGSTVGTGDATCARGGSRFVTGADVTYACNGGPGPQGDQGSIGEPGARGASGPKGDTGPTGPAGTPCDTTTLQQLVADVATLMEFKRSVESADCPPRWSRTPETGFSGTLCTRVLSDGSTDEMVKVGDYWIDRFELFNCGGDPGSQPGFDVSSQTTGRTTAVGCSRRGVAPQGSITWFQAAQMCANAGKRLCSNAEWQTAASGTPDPGAGTEGDHGPSLRVTLACNVARNKGEGSYASGSGEPANTLAHADCVSRFGAYDMVGNVWEWIADWAVEPGYNGVMSAAPSTDAPYGADGYWHGGDTTSEAGYATSGSHMVNLGTTTGRWPAAGFRGGAWANSTGAGAFALGWSNAPSDWLTDTGARCCAGGK